MPLSFTRAKRADTAFTAAITYLAARDPFRSLPFGPLAQTVGGSVGRGHYVLAVEEGRVAGVTCWALAATEVADRWLNGTLMPSYEEASEGDTVVLLLGGGDHPAVALGGIRHIARLYPGRRYLMNRFGRPRTSRGRFPPAVPGEA